MRAARCCPAAGGCGAGGSSSGSPRGVSGAGARLHEEGGGRIWGWLADFEVGVSCPIRRGAFERVRLLVVPILLWSGCPRKLNNQEKGGS